MREIDEALDISIERVRKILNDHLDMRKLCARWVPRLLTIDHNTHTSDNFKGMFGDVEAQSKGFLASIYNCGRNVNPLLYTRDQGTIETVDFSW